MIRIFDDKEKADELYMQILSNKAKFDQVDRMKILGKEVVVLTKGVKK